MGSMPTKKHNLVLIRDREIVKYVRANCLSNRQKMFRVAKYALFPILVAYERA
jgi:hypothetical protein